MKLPLESITVGKRRREDYGDIKGLAESMERYGLLHPVVIDEEANLVAGGRRLRAAHLIGWKTIEVRDLGELTEAERDEIELEENSRRKDLTPYERSKTLVKLAETAKRVLQEQADLRTESVQKPRGRPSQPDSERAVAERLGIPRQTIRDAEQHVQAVEKYPELQGGEVTQQAATDIARGLDVLPETEREERREALRTIGPKALTLADGEAFPTGKLTPEQKAFYSASQELMRLAKWKAIDPVAVANVPPADAVHPAVVELGKVVEWVSRVHSALKAREERPTLRAVQN